MASNLLAKAVSAVSKADKAFFKYISANDAGASGGHQEGFYIPKSAASIAFERLGVKGENMERFVCIRWQDDFKTESRFIYYGKGTRNEYRLTRFGRGFPFLTDQYVGALPVIVQEAEDCYSGYILNADEEVESFLETFGIAPNASIGLIDKEQMTSEVKIQFCVEEHLANSRDFPNTESMARLARALTKLPEDTTVDTTLQAWIETEYDLFRSFENALYADTLASGFSSVDALIITANTLLNRRKSRAGKSLEHHLAQIFTDASLRYEAQVVTEGNKKPDFIFPSGAEYHNFIFDPNGLVFLAAKTTCKDRRRQILNEADRIPTKHLFTLQKGISAAQLREMQEHGVQPVIPRDNIRLFPGEYRSQLLTLSDFIHFVGETQRTSGL